MAMQAVKDFFHTVAAPIQYPQMGFGSYARLGLSNHPIKDRDGSPENLLEKIGDVMTWHVVELPKKIWNFISDPRVVTIALTAFALLAITAICYPLGTWLTIKAIVVAVLPYLTPWILKLAICIFANYTILGFGFRALGRMYNQKLIDAYADHHSKSDSSQP